MKDSKDMNLNYLTNLMRPKLKSEQGLVAFADSILRNKAMLRILDEATPERLEELVNALISYYNSQISSIKADDYSDEYNSVIDRIYRDVFTVDERIAYDNR